MDASRWRSSCIRHRLEVCEQSGSNPALLEGVSILINPLFDLPVLLHESGGYFEL
jgi:hypothetical protein